MSTKPWVDKRHPHVIAMDKDDWGMAPIILTFTAWLLGGPLLLGSAWLPLTGMVLLAFFVGLVLWVAHGLFEEERELKRSRGGTR